MHKFIRVDPTALDQFVNDYYMTPLPDGSVSTILTKAFTALIKANVLCFEDGRSLQPTEVTMHGGRLMATNLNGDPNEKVWANAHSFKPSKDDNSLLPIEGLVEALAYALAAILNSPAGPGKVGRPWSRN